MKPTSFDSVADPDQNSAEALNWYPKPQGTFTNTCSELLKGMQDRAVGTVQNFKQNPFFNVVSAAVQTLLSLVLLHPSI